MSMSSYDLARLHERFGDVDETLVAIWAAGIATGASLASGGRSERKDARRLVAAMPAADVEAINSMMVLLCNAIVASDDEAEMGREIDDLLRGIGQ